MNMSSVLLTLRVRPPPHAEREGYFSLPLVNKASPKLFLACADGDHIKSAILIARKAGKGQQEYVKFTFTDILITSYQTNGDASANSQALDSISLNFAAIEIEYKEQKPDGSLGAGTKVKYNLKEMTSK